MSSTWACSTPGQVGAASNPRSSITQSPLYTLSFLCDKHRVMPHGKLPSLERKTL